MLERVANDLKLRTGVVQIADFGVLFTRENRTTCEVSAGVEQYDGTFRLFIAVSHVRGGSFRRRVVSWPYSKHDARELHTVIADLRAIESPFSAAVLTDHRSAFGRFFDRLTGRAYLGGYDLTSPVRTNVPVSVRAEISSEKHGLLVTLKETRSTRGISYAHVLQEAIRRIREVVEAYVAGLSR